MGLSLGFNGFGESNYFWVGFYLRERERHWRLQRGDEEIMSCWGLMRDFSNKKKIILSETLYLITFIPAN